MRRHEYASQRDALTFRRLITTTVAAIDAAVFADHRHRQRSLGARLRPEHDSAVVGHVYDRVFAQRELSATARLLLLIVLVHYRVIFWIEHEHVGQIFVYGCAVLVGAVVAVVNGFGCVGIDFKVVVDVGARLGQRAWHAIAQVVVVDLSGLLRLIRYQLYVITVRVIIVVVVVVGYYNVARRRLLLLLLLLLFGSDCGGDVRDGSRFCLLWRVKYYVRGAIRLFANAWAVIVVVER